MQDNASLSKNRSPASSLVSNAGMPDSVHPAVEESSSVTNDLQSAEPAASKLDQSLTALKESLEEHKGKLAIGAAATLGLMVFYKWREKQMAEEEPQEYERLRRIKNRVRHADEMQADQDETDRSSSAQT
jgi:hypothetical protein